MPYTISELPHIFSTVPISKKKRKCFSNFFSCAAKIRFWPREKRFEKHFHFFFLIGTEYVGTGKAFSCLVSKTPNNHQHQFESTRVQDLKKNNFYFHLCLSFEFWSSRKLLKYCDSMHETHNPQIWKEWDNAVCWLTKYLSPLKAWTY